MIKVSSLKKPLLVSGWGQKEHFNAVYFMSEKEIRISKKI